MAQYKLANGYVLTDEEIEARAREWEDGTWKGELTTRQLPPGHFCLVSSYAMPASVTPRSTTPAPTSRPAIVSLALSVRSACGASSQMTM